MLLAPVYVDDSTFDGSSQQSTWLLNVLLERGAARGYFLDPSNSLFISDSPAQEAVERREFGEEGHMVNSISGSRYLGAYVGVRV